MVAHSLDSHYLYGFNQFLELLDDGALARAPPSSGIAEGDFTMISSLSKRGPVLLPVLAIALFTLFPAILSAQVVGGAGDDLFDSVILLPVDGYLLDLETGDMDEDGRPDLVTADDDDNLTIYFGNGDGTFTTGDSFDAGNSLRGFALGDVNDDGHQDAVTISRYDPELRVLLGNGLGEFTQHWTDNSPDYPTAMALGSIGADGDDDLDLVVDWPYDQEIRLLNGVGDGTFTTDGNFAVGRESTFITFADLTSNGIMDFAVANEQDNSVSILKYTDGNYTHRADYAVGEDPTGLAFADLDEDGDEDLAVACRYDGLTILENMGNGVFSSHSTLYLNGYPEYLLSTDLNLDGHLDLAIKNYYNPLLTVLIGLGNLTFEAPRYYLTDAEGTALAVDDMDQDGDPDIAVSSGYDGYVAIFLNNTLGPGYIVTGPGRGETNPPLVRVFDPMNVSVAEAEWTAYGADNYGVNVACGDLTLDSKTEVLTGPGPGEMYGPQVRGFLENGTPISEISFLAYGTNKFGVNVTCGDVDGDIYPEIITGAGAGAVFGPHVRGWNWDGEGEVSTIPTISFFAYSTPKWGVNVSCGDIDGDGFDEIITGAGPGSVYGPHVRGWNVDDGPATAISAVSFLAYGTNQFGVNVACGDIDGDGISEIITGAGPGNVFGPHVRGWNWDGSGPVEVVSGVSFFAYSAYTQWGVNVGCGDVDGDGIDEILTGPGPGEGHFPWVRGFNYDGSAITAVPGIDFLAYDPDHFSHGVKVAGAGSR